MPHATIWFFWLLASCGLIVAPAFADDTVSLTIATKSAPAISFKDDQGRTQPLSPEQHKLSIVHFWATWCAPCIAELPEVEETAKTYAEKGVYIAAVSLDGDNMNKVKTFYASHNITHLAPYLAPDTASFNATGLQGLPGTLFIDSTGKEIARADGPLDWKGKEVTGFIEKALK